MIYKIKKARPGCLKECPSDIENLCDAPELCYLQIEVLHNDITVPVKIIIILLLVIHKQSSMLTAYTIQKLQCDWTKSN
jgi:hypothetical protein